MMEGQKRGEEEKQGCWRAVRKEAIINHKERRNRERKYERMTEVKEKKRSRSKVKGKTINHAEEMKE